MANDENFEPWLGRMRAGGSGKRARKFLHRVLAAANLARGGAAIGRGRSGFTGSRIGRGAGVGRVLLARDRFAAFRQRRVVVKARTVRLGKSLDAAKAHLRYVERDGTTRDGGRGQLYGADSDQVDRKVWLEQAEDDRHQFRFIVSAEDGTDYEDLKPLTRRLMSRMEEDLGTRLDWVAVDHFNTGHPHTHIILRGKDDRGQDLIIARDYISHGLRERACELVDLDLGPRNDHAIEQRLRAEIGQERLTSIDRALIRDAEANMLASSNGRDAFDQTIRMGRLKTLERLGLADQVGAAHWRLAPDLANTLRTGGLGTVLPCKAAVDGIRRRQLWSLCPANDYGEKMRLVEHHLRGHRQSGPQAHQRHLAWIEADAHTDALDDLGEVAGARLERQQRKFAARARREALDLTG